MKLSFSGRVRDACRLGVTHAAESKLAGYRVWPWLGTLAISLAATTWANPSDPSSLAPSRATDSTAGTSAAAASAPDAAQGDPWFVAKDLLSHRKWADAEAELRKQVASFPDHPEGYLMLGNALRRTGKTKEAILSLQKALDLNPGHRGAHEAIGSLYLLERQPEKAKAHLAILKRACSTRACPEVRRLSDAVAAYSP